MSPVNTALLITDQALRRYWDTFVKDRPQLLPKWDAVLCASVDNLSTLLDEVTPQHTIVVVTVLSQIFPEVVCREMVSSTAEVATTDFLTELRRKSSTAGDCVVSHFVLRQAKGAFTLCSCPCPCYFFLWSHSQDFLTTGAILPDFVDPDFCCTELTLIY